MRPAAPDPGSRSRLPIPLASLLRAVSLPVRLTGSVLVFAVPVASVQALLGKKASMPCDVQPYEPDDAVHMVLWFREMDGAPEGEPLYR